MTAKERTLWQQAVWVLRQNSIGTVAVDVPRVERMVARARSRGISQRR
jgi:hypothetical protein